MSCQLVNLLDLRIWWVFKNENYYPSYGLDDLQKTFKTKAEAIEFAKTIEEESTKVQIINIEEFFV